MNSVRSYWPGLGFLLVGLLWGIGCGGKKVDPLELGRRFNQAEQALEGARNQGTQELAESAFFEAEQLLAQAKQAKPCTGVIRMSANTRGSNLREITHHRLDR